MSGRAIPSRRTLLQAAAVTLLIAGYFALGVWLHLAFGTHVVYSHAGYIPIVLACLWWGRKGLAVKLTIGNDAGTAAAINAMGAQHCECPVTECLVDKDHKVVTTPAYMLARGPADVFEGVRKLVAAVLKLAR